MKQPKKGGVCFAGFVKSGWNMGVFAAHITTQCRKEKKNWAETVVIYACVKGISHGIAGQRANFPAPFANQTHHSALCYRYDSNYQKILGSDAVISDVMNLAQSEFTQLCQGD